MTLRSANISAFGTRPYSETQELWKTEIAEKLKELNQTEQVSPLMLLIYKFYFHSFQEIDFQRETLLTLQKQQLAKKEVYSFTCAQSST
jgi:hypothetical protein